MHVYNCTPCCAKLVKSMGEMILQDMEKRLASALVAVKKDLASVRTGRAKPSIVEDVKVEAYGGVMSLRELATITVPDTTLIVISPWDKSLVAAISSAIQKADLNVAPVVDAGTVKISIPPLTEERRRELVKLVHQKLESGRVMMRQVRTDIKVELEKLEGESGVSEDDIKMWMTNMQKIVDENMGKLDEIGTAKEQELMTI